MRVVALEEHFTVPDLVKKYIKPEAIAARGFKPRTPAAGPGQPDGAARRRSANGGSSRWTTPASRCT